MCPPEGKNLKIDTVFQNRLNIIKIMKFDVNLKNGSRVLGVTPGGIPSETSFSS